MTCVHLTVHNSSFQRKESATQKWFSSTKCTYPKNGHCCTPQCDIPIQTKRSLCFSKNLDATFNKSETSFSFRIFLREDSFPLNFKKFNILKNICEFWGGVFQKQKCSNFMQKQICLSLQKLFLTQLISKISWYAIFEGEKTWLKCDQKCLKIVTESQKSSTQ